MFEDWKKAKQTATDHDFEKDFQIPINTLKKWRLENKGPMHFRLGDKILYPRAAFIEWFEGEIYGDEDAFKEGYQEDVIPNVRRK